MKTVIHLHGKKLKINNFLFPFFNIQLNEGETWCIFGKNGSGKSLLSELLCGQQRLIEGKIEYPAWKENKFIRIVSFNSIYSIADFQKMYYQQRFNHTETDHSLLVEDFFLPPEKEQMKSSSLPFNIENLMNRRIIQLSSGELRKLLVMKVLLEKPKLLIFDNPFIGLDVDSRKQLDESFHLLKKNNIQLLFLVPSMNDIPSASDRILELPPPLPDLSISRPMAVNWDLFPQSPDEAEIVIKMEDVEIAYDQRVIASAINWEIKRGEKWALSGPNGSGKSTLLSYIFADNPQAYSKKLTLFDRKRGTGESIWDIKKRIGFTSSEMHLYYRKNVSCLQVIESGFFDSIGLYRKCTDKQTKLADYLLDLLQINSLRERSFMKISSGEQRLVLFARSLVKNPELLILDEPFHGLDDENKQRCLQIVESYGQQPNKSLIFVTHQQEEIPESINLRKSLAPR